MGFYHYNDVLLTTVDSYCNYLKDAIMGTPLQIFQCLVVVDSIPSLKELQIERILNLIEPEK